MAKKKAIVFHTLKKKSYNSLGDVKKEIEDGGIEKVAEFSGSMIATNVRTYCLYDNKVIARDL